MLRLNDTEKDLLKRLIEDVADAPEDLRAPSLRVVKLRLTVVEIVALRKLRTSFYASAKVDLSPKHSELL